MTESIAATQPRAPGTTLMRFVVPILRIRPVAGRAPLRLRVAWDYRDLLFLRWRTIEVEYKRTVWRALPGLNPTVRAVEDSRWARC